MSRLSLVLPAAAMLLAGVVTISTAQAAPATGFPEALKAAASQESDVAQVNWWDRHRHYRRHHRGHHDRGYHHYRRHD
ncbi:MAG TPA: hypothetical protein VJ233_05470, partial [Hyphomicrobiaceae bacterium]|nr:hypothetical protein [Hyphomicrobiaceae bacterium]